METVDAKSKVVESTQPSNSGDTLFVRTTIVAEKNETESINIIDVNGKLLCRINISLYPNNKVNIDVISTPKFSKSEVINIYDSGKRVCFMETSANSLTSIMLEGID